VHHVKAAPPEHRQLFPRTVPRLPIRPRTVSNQFQGSRKKGRKRFAAMLTSSSTVKSEAKTVSAVP
jgi:hypothetical protein